ncbi:MAG: DEAD/DEAH box helicase [Deltaproteobacteria bacterium]|nr:DEAD/DEAH box helicase [Deltaproteobacteria bacterium]
MCCMPDNSNQAQADRALRRALGDVGLAFFNFPSLSEVQRRAIPSIAEGHNTLVCAATAAGKTEAVIAPLVWTVRRQTTIRGRHIQLLAVAPTRALVADLTSRLEVPLARIGWRCGAQTSDFDGAAAAPELLVTTPESLDSMLVRRFKREDGKISGHALSHVRAVFVDEAHAFDSTARGDQLRFLLQRLRKLRAFARDKGWCDHAALQLCGASATVHEPQELATRLLGTEAKVVVCPGRRPIDVLTEDDDWLRLEEDTAPVALTGRLPRVTDAKSVGRLVWAALKAAECRKVLMFVPSRRECDMMGKELRQFLHAHRAMWVESHHGSLSREHRLRVEKEFHSQRDAVLVATNTLEVGVDIGDVDVVALVGAPPDTSSLLQRIGRGGRRSGLTRLLPLTRNPVEAAALASQLVNAAAGRLEVKRRFRRWDVFPQQVISYIRQNQGQGRSQRSLSELASDVWQQEDTATVANVLLEAWQTNGHLDELRGRLHLGGEWQRFEREEDQEKSCHSNIRSSPVGLVVRNEMTGEIIGHVTAGGEGETMTIGGRQHRVIRQEAEIVVTPVASEGREEGEDTPKYAGRRRRVTETFAAQVRDGCGLDLAEAPLVRTGAAMVWFHFGGEYYETLLRELWPAYFDKPVLAGIAIRVRPCFIFEDIRSNFSEPELARFTGRQGLRLIEDEGLGRFAEDVSDIGVKAMLAELHVGDHFRDWIESRRVERATPIAVRPTLEAILRRFELHP